MDADRAAWEQCSAARVVPPVQPRKLAEVPFVELADGRLQGVVSSGSDIERVYVSSITVGAHAYNCSTNNNRPCGGLRGSPSSLPSVDAWVPPWSTLAVPEAPAGPVADLLAGHPTACDAIAGLLAELPLRQSA